LIPIFLKEKPPRGCRRKYRVFWIWVLSVLVHNDINMLFGLFFIKTFEISKGIFIPSRVENNVGNFGKHCFYFRGNSDMNLNINKLMVQAKCPEYPIYNFVFQLAVICNRVK